MLFFLAGFDTVSSVLSFTAHELAIHPDIQAKLQTEIDEIVENEGGMTYENIMSKMKYLDMVVHGKNHIESTTLDGAPQW